MRVVPVALSSLLLFSGNAWAWGDTGHKIICEIAMRSAAPSTRAEIRKLIKLDSEFDFFSDSCTWPDHPRKRPDEHFLNLPRSSDGLTSETCGDAPRCVLTAIRNDVAVLSSKTATQKEKLAALKFLGHWVGDIHQPLHVSFKDDRGGNQINVTGACTSNLHSTWDTCLVIAAVGDDVDDAVTALMNDITAAKREVWIHSDPMDWANESFAIAESPDAKYCSQQGDTCSPIAGSVRVDEAYMKANIPTIKLQLQKAGIRLAHLLDGALGK
jgi:hypothetical protein